MSWSASGLPRNRSVLKTDLDPASRGRPAALHGHGRLHGSDRYRLAPGEAAGIDEKTIFYGIETIVTDKFFWKIYSIIKKVSPPFVQFYTLPPEKMHGVVMRVVM